MSLATTSVDAGLDFACQLLQNEISHRADEHPDEAPRLLRSLCFYIEFRYVGEQEMALEQLAGLAHSVELDGHIAPQFWAQMTWLAEHLELTSKVREALRLPEAAQPSSDIGER